MSPSDNDIYRDFTPLAGMAAHRPGAASLYLGNKIVRRFSLQLSSWFAENVCQLRIGALNSETLFFLFDLEDYVENIPSTSQA